MALLPVVIDAASPVPVLAAGGIGDGRGLAAALAMGCVGVWVGTRLLATIEGGAMDINKEKILQSTDEDTRVSVAYTGKTLRANYNRYHDLWEGSGLDPLPFPAQVLISSALIASFIEAGEQEYVGFFHESHRPFRRSDRWTVFARNFHQTRPRDRSRSRCAGRSGDRRAGTDLHPHEFCPLYRHRHPWMRSIGLHLKPDAT